ncbi:MAG: thioredoxin [Balneolaceae bacterium]
MNTATKKAKPFSELIKSDIPVLVDFYTDWCGPCKLMEPILKDLKAEMKDDIHIVKIDAEKNADAAILYQVRGVPTLILFHQGNILWQKSGVVRLKELKSTISQKIGAE